MRRKPILPDTRPDWRDPAMPVLRDYIMTNGTKKTIVDPDYESRYREFLINSSSHKTYHNDPTYNLRRRK